MTDTETLTEAALRQFTGTETWYRHGLAPKVLYTDGVKYVADTAGAYWLIDEIAFAQALPAVAAESFQHWKLAVDTAKSTAVLTCDDGNDRIVMTKEIERGQANRREIRDS